jgi:putative transposase
MADLFYLTEDQLARIRRYFPKPRGVPRVDDLRVLSGIIHVLKRGLQWRDAPVAYGPHKTLYNRFIRWSEMGIFDKIFSALVAADGAPDQLQIDATHLKVHRTAASLAKKGLCPVTLGVQNEALIPNCMQCVTVTGVRA